MKQHLPLVMTVLVVICGLLFVVYQDQILSRVVGTAMTSKHVRRALTEGSKGSDWKTNWSKSSIDYKRELMSGGPPRDGIPPIDKPSFVSITDAAEWLMEREPVVIVTGESTARAYPLQILMWHEIVNDVVDGKPLTVTYCPLCNAAIVFDRVIDGKTYDFGTSGMLRNSDLVMWDRQTESLWQQVTGEALVGDMVGKKLTVVPSLLTSFHEFRRQHPAGEVLARDKGSGRRYGQNPYVGYDRPGNRPFLYRGNLDDRLPATARIVGFLNGDGVAFSYDILREARVTNAKLDNVSAVIFHAAGTVSAMDSAVIAQSRDIGSVGVFERTVESQQLDFQPGDDGAFQDRQTGSTWTVTGLAIAGAMKGRQLKAVAHFNHFWFAWQAFYPKTKLHHKKKTPSQ